jgi:hypothetical protein
MKKFSITAMLLTLLFSSHAQTPDWAWAVMGTGDYVQEPRQVAVDASGNVYMTGRFGSPTLNIAPMNIPNSGATGTDDYFLAKYDATGLIKWVNTIGGPGNEQGMAVSLDASGNIYVAGRYTSPSILSGSLTNNSNSGLGDIFILKYNSSGNIVWAKSYGGSSDEWPVAFVADAAGNTYLAGNFSSIGVNFSGHGVIQSGGGDAFVTRFNTSGSPQWAMQIGGSGVDNITSASLDAAENLVVAGEFKSSALGYSPNLVNQGGFDIFVATYDASGGVVMSASYGSTGDESAYAVATDNNSEIYIAGYFSSSALTFGSASLVKQSSSQDIYLAKLNSSGSALWANRNDGNLFSIPKTLTTDLAGYVYLGGYFQLPSMTFGSTTLTNVGGLDGYLVKYTASGGSVIWAKGIHDDGNEQPVSITTDVLGNIYMAGIFGYTLTLGQHQLIGSSLASAEIFLGKLCAVPPTPTVTPHVTACPNTIASLSVNLPSAFTLDWFDLVTDSLLHTGVSFSTATSTTVLVALRDTIHGCGMNSIQVPVSFSILPQAIITALGNTLTANVGSIPGFSWQWYDCNYGGLVAEYSNKPFTPDENGSYALITHLGTCVDTSDCFSFVRTGIQENGGGQRLIYGGEKCLYINGCAGSQCIITDLLGRRITAIRIDEEKVTIPGLMPGIYFVSTGENALARKVVVW